MYLADLELDLEITKIKKKDNLKLNIKVNHELFVHFFFKLGTLKKKTKKPIVVPILCKCVLFFFRTQILYKSN